MKTAVYLSLPVVLCALAACSVDERAPSTVMSPLAGAGASGGAAFAAESNAAGEPSVVNGNPSSNSATPGTDGDGAAGSSNASGPAGSDTSEADTSSGASEPAGGDAPGSPTSSDTPSAAGTVDPPCSGCVELVVPVTGPEQGASFQFQFPAPGADFSAGSVVWRVQVREQDANPEFFLTTDVQNGSAHSFAGLFENYRPLSTFSFPPGEWVELAVDVSARPPAADGSGFDRREVEIVALALGTTEAFRGSGTIRVFLDSAQITGVSGAQPATFTTGVDELKLNPFDPPPGTGQPIHHP